MKRQPRFNRYYQRWLPQFPLFFRIDFSFSAAYRLITSSFEAQISNFHFCTIKFRFFSILGWFQSNERFLLLAFTLFILLHYLLIGNLFLIQINKIVSRKWLPFSASQARAIFRDDSFQCIRSQVTSLSRLYCSLTSILIAAINIRSPNAS